MLRIGMLPVLSVLLIFVLSGCAARTSGNMPLSYADVMSHARTSTLMGNREAAIAGYKRATELNPVNAEPWIKLSQLYLKGGDYGHAIVTAHEGLKRQPSNWRADSVMTISGLRVAFRSLKRLHSKVSANKKLGAGSSVREEAKHLAKLLRSFLGEPVLATSGRGDRQTPKLRSAPSRSNTLRPGQSSGEPQHLERDAAPVVADFATSEHPLNSTEHAATNVSGDPFAVLKTMTDN